MLKWKAIPPHTLLLPLVLEEVAKQVSPEEIVTDLRDKTRKFTKGQTNRRGFYRFFRMAAVIGKEKLQELTVKKVLDAIVIMKKEGVDKYTAESAKTELTRALRVVYAGEEISEIRPYNFDPSSPPTVYRSSNGSKGPLRLEFAPCDLSKLKALAVDTGVDRFSILRGDAYKAIHELTDKQFAIIKATRDLANDPKEIKKYTSVLYRFFKKNHLAEWMVFFNAADQVFVLCKKKDWEKAQGGK